MRKEEMTKKERFKAALNHEETDRLATDMWAVPEVIEKLKKHYNTKNEYDIYEHLGIDKAIEAAPAYHGPRPDMWGIEYSPIPYNGGIYMEPTKQPLADFETIDEIEANYVWPSTDWFDYSAVKDQLERFKDYPFQGGYISLTYFYDQLRGTEQMLLDFAADPELAEYILYKIEEFAIAHTTKILEVCDGRADYAEVTDDLGSQNGLLMSVPMIKRYLEKHYRHNIDVVKSFGAKAFHHDDGAMTQALPWLVNEMGIQVLNPLQHHLPGWDLKQIKADYGDKICFHGGVDNQFVMPFGTTDDVEKEVRFLCENLYSDKRGYILAPCHRLQAITPVENIEKMYAIAKEY